MQAPKLMTKLLNFSAMAQRDACVIRDGQGAIVPVNATGYLPLEEGRVGEGTYGMVYATRVRASGEPVVIKVMDGLKLGPRRLFENPNETIRLLREVRFVFALVRRLVDLLAVLLNVLGFGCVAGAMLIGCLLVSWVSQIGLLRALDHPNIVRLRDVLEPVAPADYLSWNTLCLVFDKADGDLEKWMDNKSNPRAIEYITPETVRDIMFQLVGALAFMHQAGVYHRDLKPANLLLKTDAAGRVQVQVCDFGLARELHDPTAGDALKLETEVHPSATTPSGLPALLIVSPGYRAPELVCTCRQTWGVIVRGGMECHCRMTVLGRSWACKLSFIAAPWTAGPWVSCLRNC